MSPIRVNFFYTPYDKEITGLANGIPIVVGFILIGISYFFTGKSVYTFGIIISMLPIVIFCPVLTRIYNNALISFSEDGLLIKLNRPFSIKERGVLIFRKWDDIRDITFLKVNQGQIIPYKIMIINKELPDEIRILLDEYFFEFSGKKYKKLVKWIREIQPNGFDLSLKKGEPSDIP